MPGSALGSTHDKPDTRYCQEILRVLQAHGIGYFFYIGGNDTADTLRIVSEEARTASHPLRCIHVPKTVDNDLMCNDHTPGFPSAARFVTQAFAGTNLDNAAMPDLGSCRRTESATSSISAAMIPPILCASSARRHVRLATRCAVSTSRRPSTMT